MMRAPMLNGLTGTVLWACLAGVVGVGLFFVKHEVKDLEHRLVGLNEEIERNQETIHVLKAEWSYLNDPTRLRGLAEKHLAMKPVVPMQIATLDTLNRPGLGADPASALARAATPATTTIATATTSADPLRPQPRPVSRPVPPATKPAKPEPSRLAKAEHLAKPHRIAAHLGPHGEAR